MASPKRRISLCPRQGLILQEAAWTECCCIRAKDASVKVKLPERRQDRVALVDAFSADDARRESLAYGGGGVVKAEGFVPNRVEMGASIQENRNVDRTRGGAGRIGFGSEGSKERGIVQQVREHPEGDFVGVVVDSGDS